MNREPAIPLIKRPMSGSLIRYASGILVASIPWPFYEAIVDPRPVFIVAGSSPPDFLTLFWDYFPSFLGGSMLTACLAIILTTPLYLLLRLAFRGRGLRPEVQHTTAWLSGIFNCFLIFYILTTTGLAVKGPPSFLDRFMEAGGIFAFPFITTVISVAGGMLVAMLLKRGTDKETHPMS